jgi:hypothetical protein
MDDEIVSSLSNFIKQNDIADIVEVAGNNGVFAEKLINSAIYAVNHQI